MAADNTLGAPTEGLGQTVTFAAGGGGSTPQMSADSRQAVRNNASGGGAEMTSRALAVPHAPDDPTLGLLAKMGSEIIRPRVEAAQTQAFWSGMQQAASGQAIKEIADEQPWYSKLFGSTSLVDGARAYSAAAQSNALATDLETNMPQLRELSGPEFASHVAKKAQAMMTGDAATDMIIQQQAASTLPMVLKNQAKEHVRFQQVQFARGISNAMDSAFALLGSADASQRNPDSAKDEGDVLGAGLAAAQNFVKPAQMDQKLHDKLVGDSVVKALVNGNFAAYDLVVGSGKFAQLDEDAANAIRVAHSRASALARTTLPLDFANQTAGWHGLSAIEGTTSPMVIEGAKKLNEQYTQITGDRSPLVTVAATNQELLQLQRTDDMRQQRLQRSIEVAKTKQAKDDAHEALVLDSASRMATGPYYIGGLPEPVQKAAFNQVRASNPAALPLVIVQQYGLRTYDQTSMDLTQAAIEHSIREGNPSMMAEAYQKYYLPIVQASGDQGEAVAQKYAGEGGEAMKRYHQIAQGRALDPTQAAVAYGEATKAKPKALANNARDKELVAELATGRMMGIVASTGFTDKVPLANPTGLATLLAHKLDADLPIEQAVEKAKRESPEISILGGQYWQRGATTTPVDQWLFKGSDFGRVAPDTVNRGVKYSLDKYAKEAGIDSSLKVGQINDTADGVPQLYVLGFGTDGQVKTRVFSAKDINDNWIASHDQTSKADLEAAQERGNLPVRGAAHPGAMDATPNPTAFVKSFSEPTKVKGPKPKNGPHSLTQD